MNINGRKVLVLGGYGLVGTAVARELLERGPREVQIHSLTREEAESAVAELAPGTGTATLSISWGDIFGLDREATARERTRAQLGALGGDDVRGFRLFRVLAESRPDIVVDCVNTATGIAYRDVFSSAWQVVEELDHGALGEQSVETLLEALSLPRLIRHLQVLYRGMAEGGTRVYVKVGTTGTGGMGLNIPYTHSEERPSRVLLAKSALAGAHSMLLFLMARTPGAPITKEIKPAAAIGWKRIAHGPIRRKGRTIQQVEAEPRPLGTTFSTEDSTAARLLDQPLEAVYIDTGENGLFSLEEFAALTSTEQMEFVTPEEIARYLIFEIEGGNTGHDVMSALDGSVLGPTYRAGILRHRALEKMVALQAEHGTRSVAFEMLGPPRVSKLLFEAHLIRETFGSIHELANQSAEEVCRRLNAEVRRRPELANEAAAVGVPMLLASGELIRGPRVLVPSDAHAVPVTAELLECWVENGWIDLRLANCAHWLERLETIRREAAAVSPEDTSSRFHRNRELWREGERLEPGEVVGWILSVEERGARFKR